MTYLAPTRNLAADTSLSSPAKREVYSNRHLNSELVDNLTRGVEGFFLLLKRIVAVYENRINPQSDDPVSTILNEVVILNLHDLKRGAYNPIYRFTKLNTTTTKDDSEERVNADDFMPFAKVLQGDQEEAAKLEMSRYSYDGNDFIYFTSPKAGGSAIDIFCIRNGLAICYNYTFGTIEDVYRKMTVNTAQLQQIRAVFQQRQNKAVLGVVDELLKNVDASGNKAIESKDFLGRLLLILNNLIVKLLGPLTAELKAATAKELIAALESQRAAAQMASGNKEAKTDDEPAGTRTFQIDYPAFEKRFDSTSHGHVTRLKKDYADKIIGLLNRLIKEMVKLASEERVTSNVTHTPQESFIIDQVIVLKGSQGFKPDSRFQLVHGSFFGHESDTIPVDHKDIDSFVYAMTVVEKTGSIKDVHAFQLEKSFTAGGVEGQIWITNSGEGTNFDIFCRVGDLVVCLNNSKYSIADLRQKHGAHWDRIISYVVTVLTEFHKAFKDDNKIDHELPLTNDITFSVQKLIEEQLMMRPFSYAVVNVRNTDKRNYQQEVTFLTRKFLTDLAIAFPLFGSVYPIDEIVVLDTGDSHFLNPELAAILTHREARTLKNNPPSIRDFGNFFYLIAGGREYLPLERVGYLSVLQQAESKAGAVGVSYLFADGADIDFMMRTRFGRVFGFNNTQKSFADMKKEFRSIYGDKHQEFWDAFIDKLRKYADDLDRLIFAQTEFEQGIAQQAIVRIDFASFPKKAQLILTDPRRVDAENNYTFNDVEVLLASESAKVMLLSQGLFESRQPIPIVGSIAVANIGQNILGDGNLFQYLVGFNQIHDKGSAPLVSSEASLKDRLDGANTNFVNLLRQNKGKISEDKLPQGFRLVKKGDVYIYSCDTSSTIDRFYAYSNGFLYLFGSSFTYPALDKDSKAIEKGINDDYTKNSLPLPLGGITAPLALLLDSMIVFIKKFQALDSKRLEQLPVMGKIPATKLASFE